MVRARVLIVDDEAAIRRATQRVLERHDFEVLLAGGGAEACELLEEHTVDVVLIDLNMPGMSGATLYHVIATQWPVLANRVVVMSGDSHMESHEAWLSINQLPLVHKPFLIRELVDVVEHVLPPDRLREANGQ